MIESARSTDWTPLSRASVSWSALDFGSMALRRITSLFIATCIRQSDQALVDSLAPLLRGEGRGEGLSRQNRKTQVCGDSPSPGSHLRCDPTSPRKRGEVGKRSQSRPAPRAHLYLAPSTSTGSSVE